MIVQTMRPGESDAHRSAARSSLDGDDPCSTTLAELHSERVYDAGGGTMTGRLKKVTDYGHPTGATVASVASTEVAYDGLGLVTSETRSITAFGIGPASG